MMAYFLLSGRHKLILSPEEEFAVTKGEAEYKVHLTSHRERASMRAPFSSRLSGFPHEQLPRSKRPPTRRPMCAGRDLPFVKVGIFDVDGIMRGKYMARDKFESRSREGLRLLRRGAGLGFERPALRQRRRSPAGTPPIRTPRCASCRRPAAHPVRGRHAVLPRASSPATREAVCPRGMLRRVLARKPRTWASPSRPRPSSSSSSSTRRRIRCARRAIAT